MESDIFTNTLLFFDIFILLSVSVSAYGGYDEFLFLKKSVFPLSLAETPSFFFFLFSFPR